MRRWRRGERGEGGREGEGRGRGGGRRSYRAKHTRSSNIILMINFYCVGYTPPKLILPDQRFSFISPFPSSHYLPSLSLYSLPSSPPTLYSPALPHTLALKDISQKKRAATACTLAHTH